MGKEIEINDISRLAEWDEASFHWLYREYYKSLVAYAMRFLDDASHAEDIVEELFVRLYDTRPQFVSFQALRHYLYNCVCHRCIDYIRHRDTVNNVAKEMASGGEAAIEEDEAACFREEFYRRLFKTIDSMPARQRAVFVAAMEGKTNKEIAEELGVSIDTVKTQKKRGMKTLREEMRSANSSALLEFFLLLYIM